MLTQNEARLLNILLFLEKKQEKADLKKLDEIRKKNMKEDLNWSPLLEKHLKNGLIIENNEYYSLTQKGRCEIISWNKERSRKGFNRSLLIRDKSKVYRKFCERIYGKFLCQMNMTNMVQLEKLIELLELSDQNNILDLGCGMGRISEYISYRTNAGITGIDIADEAISAASERTKSKKDRIKFQVGNIDELNFPPDSFDRIIAIDTVYFSQDLPKLLNKLKEILTNDGRMGFFYSQRIGKEHDRIMLQAGYTNLANALKANGFKFTTREFTEDEKKHWIDEISVANELKNEFEAAAEMEIYHSRIREASDHLGYIEDKRLSRYLYVIEKDMVREILSV